MLVLSRKFGERVLIGDNVVVTVVRIGPNSVRLGIQAPKEMNILRDELGPVASDYREVDVPLDGVIVPGLFSECHDCQEKMVECVCVGADA